MITETLTVEKLLTENAELKKQLQVINEQYEWLRRQIFGKKSEKIVEAKKDNVLYFEGFEKFFENKPEKNRMFLLMKEQNLKGMVKIKSPFLKIFQLKNII